MKSRGAGLAGVGMGLMILFSVGLSWGEYPCTGTLFDDVNEAAVGSTFCGFIEQFSHLGITAGCSANPPLYCPDDLVNRAQMAVFVTRAVEQKKTPQQIALLKWYDTYGSADFIVGSAPSGIAFDGANIWVTNYWSNSVTKLRANDGANLGTFTVGELPAGIAFDGANIWVANEVSGNVSKLRASDRASMGTYPVGTYPARIAFDGANIWVTNRNSNSVSKL